MLDKKQVWTREDLENLTTTEHSFQEFKSSRFLVNENHEISSEFIFKFSKQVSAFANAQGGRVFLGIRDDGSIDEGIPIDVKSGGTKAWLENLIQDLVTPRLQEYNVFEVLLSKTRAAYIIDIPNSEHAPHQAKDQRYYLRIAGMSRPMDHIHIEDVFRRNKNPSMNLARIAPYGAPDVVKTSKGTQVVQAFRLHLVNEGKSMARHVGGEVSIARHFVTKEARQRIESSQEIHYTQKPAEMVFFHYLGIPVFPSQEVFFMIFWVSIHKRNLALVRQNMFVRWQIYADDSIPRTQEADLASFTAIQKILNM